MKDLTQGSIPRTILTMAAPVAAGMIFQTLYLLVDLYFVSALGDAAIAGVGAAGTLFFMVMALSQVLGVSSVALISQAVGRKDQDQANLVFNQSMVLAGLCAAITLICGYTLGDAYMSTIAAGDAQSEGVTFLYWFLPGMAMQFALMGMGSALRATGIVKPTMVVQVLTIILNIILAPVLIAGWGPGPALGVMGAGLATSISTTVGVLLLIIYFIKLEKYVSFNFSLWKPQFPIWANAQYRPASWRRNVIDVWLFRHGLLADPGFWRNCPGRFQYWRAYHAINIHAYHGNSFCYWPYCRTKFRSWPWRSCEANFFQGNLVKFYSHGYGHRSASISSRITGGIFY